jgi:hypothetical protein
MKIIKALVLVLLGVAWLGTPAGAQTNNTWSTDIETFEAQTNVIIVKGFGVGGTVSVGNGVLNVGLKESYSPDTGGKWQAIVLDCSQDGEHEWAVIDYAEIESLLKAIDFSRSATYAVTGLPGFESTYHTKDGFRVIALGSHRQSVVQNFVQFWGYRRIQLDSDQMSQLRSVISQARDALDELKPAK